MDSINKYYKMINIKKSETIKNFKGLLKLCIDNSSYFSLTKNYCIPSSPQLEFLLSKLNYFQIKQFNTIDWHCYHVKEINPLTIYIFSITDAKNIEKIFLNSDFVNIFLNTNPNLEDNGYMGYIEDLCFFSKSNIIFGTVSHESICNIYPKSIKMYEKFSKYAQWEKRDITNKNSSEYLNINDYI